jgi:hypothetical protein
MRTTVALLAACVVLSLAMAAGCRTAGSAPGPAMTATTMPTSQPASARPPIKGRLVKVDGKDLIIRLIPRQAAPATEDTVFATDADTQFIVDFAPGKLADLKPGMSVSVVSIAPRGTRPKAAVLAYSRGLGGTVVRVEGTNVVIRVSRRRAGLQEVTVVTDAKTRIITDTTVSLAGGTFVPKLGTLADIKPNARVMVVPTTGIAATIILNPPMGDRASRPATMPANRPGM